jgi:asparagine synthase (glutamine-hydrolysing)
VLDPDESMSGICGIVNFNGAPVDPGVLDRMVQAAAHRGPDGVGRWLNGKVGLANLRMNITPESVRERQPQASLDDAFVLTASARIDNRDDLIAALGDFLRTAEPTDADLILAAYGKWGEDCALHLIGDYAFAIWDARREGLFAARDPMGFRPLYYRHEPRRLLFASEVKQILAVPGVPKRLFEPALAMHLAMAMAHFPAEWTFYEGVLQCPAGWSLWCNDRTARTWQHWDVGECSAIRYSSEDEYVEHFRETLTEAVRVRLRSRKPVGIMLSGGLDSGAVASMVGWLAENDTSKSYPAVHTYSWAFNSLTECDERQISDQIVRRYGFEAESIPVEDHVGLEGQSAPVSDADGPSLQPYSPLHQRALATAGSHGVGAMLSGFRGDLVVGSGSFDYLQLALAGQWLTLLNHIGAHTQRSGIPAHRLARNWILTPLGWAILWSRAMSWAAGPVFDLRHAGRNPFPQWIRNDFAERTGLRRLVLQPRPYVRGRGLANRQRARLIFFPLAMRAVVEQERHNAGFGLGFSDPWSDRRLAEFAISVPQHMLSRIGEPKRITRLAMRGVMPEEVRRSARKTVLAPLWNRMLKVEGRQTIETVLGGSELGARGFVSEAKLQKHYGEFLRGRSDDGRFWNTITAELWLRRHWTT